VRYRLRFSQRGTAVERSEWQRRPVLSVALRVAVFAGPVLGSFGIALLLSRMLPRASGGLSAALLIAVVAGASLVTLVVFERAARKLLPLAALLNLSLLFPDKAPQRFAVARATGNPRDLQDRLEKARAGGHSDDAAGLQAVVELVLALSVHDKGTRGHSERVRVFADLLADELKIDEASRARLRWAALLHDVGKLHVPTTILNKPDRPDAAEWEVLHRHPEEGARLVAPLLPWLGDWGHAVVEHHERWDGTGYPRGLRASQISLAARIVSVADTYEVMTAPRAYKRPMSVAASRRELTRAAGTQLDPHVVRAFLNISVGRLWRTVGLAAWVGQIPALGRFLEGLTRAGAMAGSGVATVATAGLVVAGSIATPALAPSFSGPAAVGPSAPSSPVHGGLDQPGQQPGGAAGGPSQSAGGHAGVAPTSPAAAGRGGGSSQTPGAQPMTAQGVPASSSAAATPTTGTSSTPTPAPTPDPWSCASCTNAAPGCTNHCHNDNATACLTYCQGNNNVVCTSHCFGNNNVACLNYCVGTNNKVCQTNCRTQATTAAFRADSAPYPAWWRSR